MQAKSRNYAPGALSDYALAMLLTAGFWDVLGAAGLLPDWWPPVSYVLIAVGIFAGTAAVLLGLLVRSRAEQSKRHIALELVALGIMLLGWLVRGDAEVPVDLPIVGAEVVGAVMYGYVKWRSLMVSRV